MDAQFVTFDLSKLFAELISDRQFESYLNFHNAMQSFTKTSGCVYKHGRTAYMKADSVRRSTLMYRHFTLRCAVTDCPSCFKVSAKGYYLRVIRSNMLHKHPVQTSKEQPQPIVADHTEVFQEHFQGRSFDSFESLQEAVKDFENVTGSRFVIRLCRLLKEDHELAGTDKSDKVLREPSQLKSRVFRTEETDQTTSYESLDKWHTEERSPDATTDVHALNLEEDTSKPLLPSELTNFRLLESGLGEPVADEWIARGDFLPLSTSVDLPGELVVEAASGRVFHRPTGRLIAPLIETSSQEATERDLQEAEPADPLVGSHLPRPACTTTRTQSLSPISPVATRSDGTCFKVNRTVDDITPDTPTVVL
nr:unnamed protein product [Spirometra erinaceieuropaei]